jgi:Zn-dependent M32 family carboxypeptidase
VSAAPACDALVSHHRQLHSLDQVQAILTWDRLTLPPKSAVLG